MKKFAVFCTGIRWFRALAAMACTLQALHAQPASTPLADFWQTDGPVHAIAATNDQVYIGGDFDYVGPATGGAGVVSGATGEAEFNFPKVLSGTGGPGTVQSAAPDGVGGWYIGGNFSMVGGIVRSNLAHILSDNSVDPAWNPAPNGTNSVVVAAGGLVYVGGAFTRVGGETRNRIAALDAVTGRATAWNPNANQPVIAILPAGNLVYVSGNFTTVGGQTRNRVAALDAATGLAAAWNPNANQIVNALALDGGTIYAGGNFTSIGGRPRNRIAAIDAASGAVSDWNPNANGVVNAIAVGTAVVYAGGAFNSIGSQNRARFGAVDKVTGLAADWAADADANVNEMVLAGTSLYLAGDFTTLAGQPRSGLGVINGGSGELLNWQPAISTLSPAAPSVAALAWAGARVFAGGNFRSIGGAARGRLASLDTATGQATDWNPAAGGVVMALALGADRVYAGGVFTTMGGVARNRLAAIKAATGEVEAWDPNVRGRGNTVAVNVIVTAGSRVYIGGLFTNAGNFGRNSIASIDANTGTANAWDPNAQAQQTTTSASVNALVFAGDRFYVGGDFVRIGGQPRGRIASVLIADGTAAAWAPAGTNIVGALALNGGTLYVGGTFTNLAGQNRNRLGAVSADTGLASSWNPDASGAQARIYSLASRGGRVYAAGQFTTIGGEFRNRLASLSATTGQAQSWDPNLNGLARTVLAADDAIYAGGDFTTAGGGLQSYFAVYSNRPEFDPTSLGVSGGQFTGSLRTGDGQRVRLETSTNLQQWSEAGAYTPGANPAAVSAQGGGAPSRFFRAILEPSP